MMLWRIMTFYLPIIVGLFFTLTMKNKGIEEPQDGETEKSFTTWSSRQKTTQK